MSSSLAFVRPHCICMSGVIFIAGLFMKGLKYFFFLIYKELRLHITN